MDNTINDNKLIAKFMGLEIITDGISWFDTSFKSLKKYHESWDALKPVIDKISQLDTDHEPFSSVSLYSSISEVHKAVVEFLKTIDLEEKVSLKVIMHEAKGLVDDGENTEYTRGICELIADLAGHEGKDHADRAIEIAKELGVSQENIDKFYNLYR